MTAETMLVPYCDGQTPTPIPLKNKMHANKTGAPTIIRKFRTRAAQERQVPPMNEGSVMATGDG